MAVPVVRRYTSVVGVINVFNNMTDDVTGQAPFTLFAPNTILDIVNDPDPATGTYEMRLLKNGSETPIKLFSSSLSPTTAGRMAIGPISLSVGQYIWVRAPRSAVVVANSMIVKYANPIA
jgi:hypothetical protein